jgi:hypothetical protein
MAWVVGGQVLGPHRIEFMCLLQTHLSITKHVLTRGGAPIDRDAKQADGRITPLRSDSR